MQMNKAIWKILDSTHDVVARICDTLFKKTLVKHFDYIRFYDSGEMMYLGTNPEYMMSAFTYSLLPSAEELKLLHLAQLRNFFLSHHVPLPPGASANPERYNGIISKQAEFGIYNRLCLVDRGPNYYRGCAFGVRRSSKSIFTYYINIIGILEKFIKYFENKVDALNSKMSVDNKIIIPHFHQKVLQIQDQIEVVQFEPELDFENNKPNQFNAELITMREKECLSLIAQGYTMKSAAIKLKISHRTVEQHLRNIKEKYGLHTKNQLVEFWHANE